MITKELQDHVWKHCLPKEFKEEVKKEYAKYVAIDDNPNLPAYAVESATSRRALLEILFGEHNLTSDVEGEEMLTVPRKTVQDFFMNFKREKSDAKSTFDKVSLGARMSMLQELFGSKCLPDEEKKAMTEGRYQYLNSLSLEDYDNETSAEEQRRFCEYQQKHHPNEVLWVQTHSDDKKPKPSEPKFKVGDEIRIVKGGVFYDRIGEVTDIDFIGSLVYYKTDRSYEWLRESDLEPYTEPSKEDSATLHAESVEESRIADEETHLRNLSQSMSICDKSDEGFPHDARKCGTVYQRRKMDMAAMIAAGILAGSDFMANDCTKEAFDKLAEVSLDCADSIISKTLRNGED